MVKLPGKLAVPRAEKSTVPAALSRQIRQFILDRKLKSGDGIPSQRELSRQLGVGVPAIREALKNLEAIGLIEICHGKRTVVKQVDVDALLNSLSPAIQLTEAEVVHLLEFKEIIETRCAFLAARRATPENLELMRQYLDLMEQTQGDDRRFAEADYLFHLTIVQAARNPVMNRVMKVIENMLARAIEKAAGLHEWRRRALKMHEQIYRAILNRQGRSASLAVEKLVEETLKRYVKGR
jgi:GntR family transcriptional repressor for pyruvate dehydrogenase complex